MAARLHAVREACKREPSNRSEENINDLVEFVKDVKFFTKLTNLQQRSLCQTMTLEVFNPSEYIFQKDDLGDKFYIILVGKVSVQVPSTTNCPRGIHEDKCDCPNRPMDSFVNLENGSGFGESALQSDQPRTVSVQAIERAETLVTKRAHYEQYAGQLHRQSIEQRVRFLRQFPRIEDALQRCLVGTQEIAAMANCLNESSLSGNEMVVKQGTPVDNMIFVRSGQLAMLRMVDHDAMRESAREERTVARPKITSRGGAKSTGRPQDDSAPDADASAKEQSQHQMTAHMAIMLSAYRKAQHDAESPDHSSRSGCASPLGESVDLNNSSSEFSIRGGASQAKTALEAAAAAAAAATQSAPLSSFAGPVAGLAPKGIAARRRWTTLQVDAGAAESVSPARAAAIERWKKVRVAWRQANLLHRLGSKGPADIEVDAGDAGQRNVDHLLDVSIARRKFANYQYKQLTSTGTARRKTKINLRSRDSLAPAPKRSIVHHHHKAPGIPESQGTAGVTRTMALQPFAPRRRLLRIGTVGAFQYFGDRQVCNNEVYPVSLVSDPTAEIYLMSKNDILRRLPKKLFSALFSPDKEAVPTDSQILEMHRQVERWSLFRGSMHAESLGNRGGVPRPLRDLGVSRSRVDPIANLEFLGVNPSSVPEVVPAPKKTSATLSSKDEELFSQASAAFLRKFDRMKRDRGLRNALAKEGVCHRHPFLSEDEEERDPNAFRFEQNWAKLGKFPMGLELQDEENLELPLGGAALAVPSAAGGRQSARRTSVSDSNIGPSIQGTPRGSFLKPSAVARSSAASGSALGVAGERPAERVFAATQMPSQSTLAAASQEKLPPLGSARNSTRNVVTHTKSTGSSGGPPHSARRRTMLKNK